MEILQVGSSSQYLNPSERKIGFMKKTLRSCFHQRDKLKLPNFTYSEIKAILSGLCAVFNAHCWMSDIDTTFDIFECAAMNAHDWMSGIDNTL